MGCLKKWILVLLAQALMAGAALAQVHGTAEEAKALIERAAAHIKSVGPEKALADFAAKDGKWLEKDLYVFVIAFDGMMLSHGTNKALMGKPMMDMKDVNGKLFTKEMIDNVKAGKHAWVDYMWSNPISKKIEHKSSIAIRAPGMDAMVGVGIYK